MVHIIDRVENTPTLLIKKIAAETSELIKRGEPILNLSQGSPCLPMFEKASESIVETLQSSERPVLPYTDVAGMIEVRKTCAKFLNHIVVGKIHHGIFQYNPDHICITNGAVGGVYVALAIQISCPNDIVLTTIPSYGLYKSDTELLGGTFHTINCGTPKDGFMITPNDIERAFDEHGNKLRCFVLCCPNNPTGRCYTNDEAIAIANEFNKQIEEYPDFSILLDEVYTMDMPTSSNQHTTHTSILNYASPKLRKSIFITVSASKGLGSVPGARAGFVAIHDKRVLEAVIKVQMATSANVSVLSQQILKASLDHVLSNPIDVLAGIRHYYKERTDFVCNKLELLGEKYYDDKSVFCPRRPDGTFYVIAQFRNLNNENELLREHYCHISNDIGGKEEFLSSSDNNNMDYHITDLHVQRIFRDAYRYFPDIVNHGVAVVPLSAFDVDKGLCMVRICCAVELDKLHEAMDVIAKVVHETRSK